MSTLNGEDYARQCRKFNKKIGEGGFGVVWQGQNLVTAQYVAIKEVHADDEALTRETLREYQLLTELRHPHIVETYAYTYDAARCTASIYMEYISQGSLTNVIKTVYPRGMPPALLSKYTGDVLKGLSCAHRKGLIHRDIKPANMLVAVSGRLKLADFGLCRRSEGEGSTAVAGTVRYMSADALKGKYNEKTDIWAVGCSLIEMASGVPPYYNVNMKSTQLTFAILHGTVRPLIPSHVGSEYLDFVKKTLSEKPLRRDSSSDDDDDDSEGPMTCESLLNHPFLSLNERLARKPFSPSHKRDSVRSMHREHTDDGSSKGHDLLRPVRSLRETHLYGHDMPHDSKVFSLRGGMSSAPTAGVGSLVEWLNSPENDNLQYVENPEQALADLLRNAVADITEELVSTLAQAPASNYQDQVDELRVLYFSRVLLAGCLRYVAVLFCRDCESHERFFSLKSVKLVVKECLSVIKPPLQILHNVEAKKNVNGLIFILEVIKEGLLLCLQAYKLHKTGWQCQRDVTSETQARPQRNDDSDGDSSDESDSQDHQNLAESLERQIAASDVLLRPGKIFDDETILVLRQYTFLRDIPARCHVFTKCFILLQKIPKQQDGTELFQQISEEMLNHVQDLSSQRQVEVCSPLLTRSPSLSTMQSLPIHMRQSSREPSDLTGRQPSELYMRQLSMAQSQRSDDQSILPESEPQTPYTPLSQLSLDDWLPLYAGLEHIFQFIVQNADGDAETLTRLFFGYPNGIGLTCMITNSDYSLDIPWQVKEKAYELILTLHYAKLDTKLPTTILDYKQTYTMPLILCDEDTRSREVLDEMFLFITFRPALDWGKVRYKCISRDEHLQFLAGVEEMRHSDRFAEWFLQFCSSKEACGDAIFHSRSSMSWLDFLGKISLFPPHNKERNFNSKYASLFPLLRYLMQCEDVGNSGLLKPRQMMLNRKRDFEPFQQYFPIATMIEDLVWMDQRGLFQIGADTRTAETRLAPHPRGHFLIRPSKREQGSLVMTANVALQDGRVKVTHKIIKFVPDVGHLVVDAFPITMQVCFVDTF